MAAEKPPKPPMANAMVMKMRETSSSLPRLLRSPLRNMRQRNSATVTSWELTLRGNVISCVPFLHRKMWVEVIDCKRLGGRGMTRNQRM